MQIYLFSGERFLTTLWHEPYLYAIYALLCMLAWRMRWLTAGGSFLAFLMALVFQQEGLLFFVLPAWLLLGGTLLGKLNRQEHEKKERSAMQVFANGGVGTLCMLASVTSHDYIMEIYFILGYFVSFSISICDTFSSEIGRYVKGKTLDILTFKPVEKGLSGGVSIAGTLGGILALFPVVLVLALGFGRTVPQVLCVLIPGIAGMLLDSVLGSVLQAKFKNENGHIIEYPKEGYVLYKGYKWCDNNLVNLLSNILVTALFLLLISELIY